MKGDIVGEIIYRWYGWYSAVKNGGLVEGQTFGCETVGPDVVFRREERRPR